MAHPSRLALLVLFATACDVAPAPPPKLTVTSPKRGLVQSQVGPITVTGMAVPGEGGESVTKVTVNNVTATLAADGSFSATVDVPAGATLLNTVAFNDGGSAATDARAVQLGQLVPVGAMMDRAVTATLSAEAFAKLASAAGPLIKGKDLGTMMTETSLGNSVVGMKINVTKLVLGDAKLTLVPTDAGLQFSIEVKAIDAVAKAKYETFLGDDSANIKVTADKIIVAGTFAVTPAGVMGFTSKLMSPTINTTNLKLDSGGVTGAVLDLMQSELLSTVRGWIKSAAEGQLGPMLNKAFGALAGPKALAVAGKMVEVQASPAAIQFTSAGALVSVNLAAKIGGGEASPGYVFTPNGAPKLELGNGIQLAIADDLVNQLLAQVHAMKLLDISYDQDFGIFDHIGFKASIPPMISADNQDGKLRLVLGDMIVNFTDGGKPVIGAAINASVDLAILPVAGSPEQVALDFGEIKLFVDILEDGTGMGVDDLSGPAGAGIKLQLDSLAKFMFAVPIPAVAGVKLESLALRADSGYAIIAGQVH
jgi:Glucodextranase, domain B